MGLRATPESIAALATAGGSLTPFLENDPILGDVDEHFSGDYMNQDTDLKAARGAGFRSARLTAPR